MSAPQIIKVAAGLACIAAALLTVFVARNDALSVRYHVASMRQASRMLDVLSGTVPQTRRDQLRRVIAMLRRRDTNAGWSDSYSRHEEALIRLGYLTRQEFAFSGGTLPTGKFYTNMLPLMADGTSSFSLSRSNGVIRVVARPTQMNSWATLIRELDGRQRP